MSQTRLFRAFATEVIKIAADIKDADIRALLAERNGEEYLEGGRLASNTAFEAQYAVKMSGYDAPVGLAATDSYDLHAAKKKPNLYQKGRDYAAAGIKGGLTGLGILGASNAMRGRFGAPSGRKAIRDAMKSARRTAGVGASIAIADRAYRHDDVPGIDKKANIVASNPNGGLQSPASQLSQAQQTGGFKSRVVHKLGKPPKVVQLGKKFRIP